MNKLLHGEADIRLLLLIFHQQLVCLHGKSVLDQYVVSQLMINALNAVMKLNSTCCFRSAKLHYTQAYSI